MHETVEKLMARPKGVLAADESFPSIKKRFEKINLESTPETRRAYREMLLTTNGMNEYISGVILFDETIHQTTKTGVSFVEVLNNGGIVPGIKVDLGTQALPLNEGEKYTEGLDGLDKRLAEYYELGARFSKWRAVINIGPSTPSKYAISFNSHCLALYAALSQGHQIVPIIEPEVLMDGNHSIQKCEEATLLTHQILFEVLKNAKVDLSNVILKTNMIVPGKELGESLPPEQIAESTVKVLKCFVPTSIGGIVFLSGGLDDISSTQYLDAVNKIPDLPWRVTFSYGRALQNQALNVWGGKEEQVLKAQEAFLKRSKLNSFASVGQYDKNMEGDL